MTKTPTISTNKTKLYVINYNKILGMQNSARRKCPATSKDI